MKERTAMISEEKVLKIVRQMVEEYVGEQKTINNAKKQKILILLTENYRLSDTRNILNISSNKYDVYIGYRSKEIDLNNKVDLTGVKEFDIKSTSREDWKIILANIDLVIVPTLTIGILMKLANLIDDELEVAIIIDALLMGKIVLTSKNHIGPIGIKRLQAPPVILEKISLNLQIISNYGVHVVPSKKLLNRIPKLLASKPSKRRPLVNTKLIRDWDEEEETTVVLPNHSIITSLAKEEATLLGIKLAFTNGDEEDTK